MNILYLIVALVAFTSSTCLALEETKSDNDEESKGIIENEYLRKILSPLNAGRIAFAPLLTPAGDDNSDSPKSVSEQETIVSTIEKQHESSEDKTVPKGDSQGADGLSNIEKAITIDKQKPFVFKKVEEFADFITQPFQVLKTIAEIFHLPLDSLIETVDKNLIIGHEAIMRPVVASLKIMEKIFKPDACKLRKFCQIGHHLNILKKKVLALSPGLLEDSEFVKSITDGILGKDCDLVFDNCELVIKPEIDKLRRNKDEQNKKQEHQLANNQIEPKSNENNNQTKNVNAKGEEWLKEDTNAGF